MEKNINICWFARSGDLDFFAKIASHLESLNSEVKSYFVCDTNGEKRKLKDEYNVNSMVLSEYIQNFDRTNKVSCGDLNEYMKKYQLLPFRKLVLSEMFMKKYNDEKLIQYLVGLISFWEKVINDNNIHYVISEIPSILPNNVLWLVCKKFNVEFIGFSIAGINEKTLISDNFNGNLLGLKELFYSVKVSIDSVNYKKAVDYYERMKRNPLKPKYYNLDHHTGKILKVEKGAIFQRPPKLKPLIGEIIRAFRRTDDITKTWYYIDPELMVLKTWLMAKIRMFIHNRVNIFENNVIVRKEKYFLYTLNMIGEWSQYSFASLQLAYPLDTIRYIASALPLGTKLYVKEHIAWFPQRSFSFYSELKSIQNVVLVDRRENIFDLIKNSLGVLSNSSTTGWEAFLLGKPVILLTDAWYSVLPGVRRADNFLELLEIFDTIAEFEQTTEDDRIKAAYCLFELGINGVLYPRTQLLEENNISQFANHINSILAKLNN
ncbi:MAG: hypothetical protein A2499_03240 [Stygiobacter sp. RIFOXYC12_FULL_38_8]|nr:MAG: hypothetical protein A2499_03240 [Stygiobacter sp. RIFOXYC12_FULL_38_8]